MSSMSRFLIIWLGQAFSLLGSGLVQFALVWWLTKKTGSATVLSVAMAMSVLPNILFGPVAGALVDRWSRRKVMVFADSVSAAATLVLALLFATDTVQIWHVYGLLLIRASAGTFQLPAMQASTTLMVPEEHLSRIAGMNQSLGGIISIAGAPAGALLLELLPMQGVLAIDVTTAILAITPLLFIQVPQPVRGEVDGEANAATSVTSDVLAGIAYVRRWPGMAMILVEGMLMNVLIAPAAALTPLVVTEHFKGGAAEYAWIDLSWGIGMVAGGILLAAWGGGQRRVATGMVAIALMGLGLAVMGVAPADAFPLAVGASLFAGFAYPVYSGSIMAAMQATVSTSMQGRVLSLSTASAYLAMPLGLALGGPVADALGAQVWYLLAGIGSMVLGIVSLFIPAIVEIEQRGAPDLDTEECFVRQR